MVLGVEKFAGIRVAHVSCWLLWRGILYARPAVEGTLDDLCLRGLAPAVNDDAAARLGVARRQVAHADVLADRRPHGSRGDQSPARAAVGVHDRVAMAGDAPVAHL